MKKVFSLILVFAMLLTILPVSAKADSITLIEVIKDNAPIRATSYEEGKVIVKCKKGAVLESTGSVYNKRVNKWYKVKYNNKEYYIFSGNVEKHEHDYKKIEYNGVTYKYCDCGKVVVETKTKVAKMSASIATYAGTAATAAAIDGPIPLGDLVAVGILVFGAYTVITGKEMTKSAYSTITSEIDLEDYVNDNSCTVDSFQMVQRVNGQLKYFGKTCLDVFEAYMYVRYANGDVHTQYQTNAMKVVALFGAGYSERDANKPDYYYHYHLGIDKNHKVGGHIFYGCTDNGTWPS